jgi:hypothetical protein
LNSFTFHKPKTALNEEEILSFLNFILPKFEILYVHYNEINTKIENQSKNINKDKILKPLMSSINYYENELQAVNKEEEKQSISQTLNILRV